MQIQIQNVSTTTINKGGKSRPYGEAKIEFLNERGETKTWTIRSFTNPSVFKTLSEAPAGSAYEITTTKNDKDFTEWSGATLVAADKVGTSSGTQARPSTPTKSTYETPEERAVRQRLIVRQSSITAALKYFEQNETKPDLENLLSLADDFHEWVYKQDEASSFDAIGEDIPY